jgi:hypothetical protein
MKQQTAVEYLVEQLFPKALSEQQYYHIEKAKQMEKDQIMQAVYDSMGTNFDPNMGRAEMYYKENYGGNK